MLILLFLEPSDNWDDGIEEDKTVEKTPEPETKEPETKADDNLESEEKPGRINKKFSML